MTPPQSEAKPRPVRQFASDNRSNICPEAWAALAAANGSGHGASYGDDPWTGRMTELVRQAFQTDCSVHLVFGGIAANCLALATACQSYHGVICHELAHIETDECGGPAFFTNGARTLPTPGADGKLTPDAVGRVANRRTDPRFPKPGVLSLTQATELGTTYAPAEVAALCAEAHARQMFVHMDGARFANAVAHLGCNPAALTWRAGVDVLCLGGTKNGISAGELVVFFNPGLAADFAYRSKQAGQTASKMRLLSCQWVGLLETGAWLAHATHANAMATRLAATLRTTPGVRVLHPVQANAVFADLPAGALDGLRARGWDLYVLPGTAGVRFLCSWDTTAADVDAVVADLRAACRG
jgi:threonine aldolase